MVHVPKHYKTYYERKKARDPDFARRKGAEARARRKERLTEYLREHPCHVCGEQDTLVLEFHHVNPSQRSFTITGSHAWSRTLEEIKKCVVLCANCHLRVHAMMRSFGL